jgi:trigger factor
MAEKPQAEETNEIKNTVKIEDVGPCKKNVSVEIPEEKINELTDEQYNDLGKEAAVPGFRKGRAPRRLLEKRFGKEATEQVKLKLLAEASEDALKDNDIDALRDPDIKFEDIELPESGSLKFDFEVEVRPEFDLPELEGIEVTKTALKVEDDQVTREVEQLQRYAGVWAPREKGGVEPEDQIIADATLKIEDVEEEEKLNNIEIYVRPNGFVGAIPVENLDEVLKGAKAGDKKTATVEVPKTFFREEYRGKKVDIEIEVEDVKWLKPAEINEEFLKRFESEDEDELKDKIRDNLQGRLEQTSRAEMTEQIYAFLRDNTNFELPTTIIAEQANSILQRQMVAMIQKGLPKEKIAEEMEKQRANSDEQAADQLKTFFIMDKVAEKLEVDVTDEEVNGHIAQLAIQQGQRPEQMREQMLRNGSLAQFRLQVREEKCIAKMLESAKIKETAPKKEAKKTAKKTTKKTEKKTTKKTAKKTTKKTEPAEKKAVKKTKKNTKKEN